MKRMHGDTGQSDEKRPNSKANFVFAFASIRSITLGDSGRCIRFVPFGCVLFVYFRTNA